MTTGFPVGFDHFLEPFGGVVHGGAGRIAPVGHEPDVVAVADRLDNRTQGVLFAPDFNVAFLALPAVHAVLGGGGLEDVGGRIPVRGLDGDAAPVDDGVPVDVAGQPAVAYDVAQSFIPSLLVGDEVSGDELVIELPECQAVALPGVIVYDLD